MNRQQLIAELRDYRILGYEVLVKLNTSTDKLQAEHDRLELEINGVKSCELTCDVIGYDEYVHGLDYDEAQPEKYGEHHRYGWKGATSLIPTGVNEDLGSQCGGVTVDPDNASETNVNYIVTLADYPQVVIKDDYTTKDLTEVTEQQLVDSLYTDKVTAELMFPGSYYQVLEVNPVNIHQQLMKFYNLETTCTTVATETSDNKFKGIPVEHYQTIQDACLSALLPDVINNDQPVVVVINQITNSNRIILGMNWSVITDAEGLIAGDNCPSEPTEFTANSFKGALKLAAKWVDSVVDLEQVGVNTVKVVTKERLTPKIELFAKFTEYTFLMQCYLELIGYFYNLSSSLSNVSSQLYLTWCLMTSLCFKRYVLMPTIGSDNHTKLLMIWHEATYNSLERKSIYA